MIRVRVNNDSDGGVIQIRMGSLKRTKILTARYKKFYSRKRLAAILREFASRVEERPEA